MPNSQISEREQDFRVLSHPTAAPVGRQERASKQEDFSKFAVCSLLALFLYLSIGTSIINRPAI